MERVVLIAQHVLAIVAPGGRYHVTARGNEREVATWPEIVRASERAKGEAWRDFVDRHGDWGRDAALWLGRRTGRMRLAHLGELAGGLDYAVVSKAMARFRRWLSLDAALRTRLAAIQRQLSK